MVPDLMKLDVGIHGPVKLIGNKGSKDEVVKDLSGNKWTYKVGLEGIEGKGLHKVDSRHNSGWQIYKSPIQQALRIGTR